MAKKNLLLIIAIIVIFIISIYIARPLIFINKAASNNSSTTSLSLENSYLFASPLQAKADGQEQIRITAFILNTRGLGVSNQKVKLNIKPNLTIKETQSTTDDLGKAIFDLSSASPAKFEITATSNNSSLPQKISVIFY